LQMQCADQKILTYQCMIHGDDRSVKTAPETQTMEVSIFAKLDWIFWPAVKPESFTKRRHEKSSKNRLLFDRRILRGTLGLFGK